jgi:hypothetical protein
MPDQIAKALRGSRRNRTGERLVLFRLRSRSGCNGNRDTRIDRDAQSSTDRDSQSAADRDGD